MDLEWPLSPLVLILEDWGGGGRVGRWGVLEVEERRSGEQEGEWLKGMVWQSL